MNCSLAPHMYVRIPLQGSARSNDVIPSIYKVNFSNYNQAAWAFQQMRDQVLAREEPLEDVALSVQWRPVSKALLEALASRAAQGIDGLEGVSGEEARGEQLHRQQPQQQRVTGNLTIAAKADGDNGHANSTATMSNMLQELGEKNAATFVEVRKKAIEDNAATGADAGTGAGVDVAVGINADAEDFGRQLEK